MNLFVVVEGGDHHVSLVDGDRFETIHRFATRYALHGGPKFSPDGRFVYFGSRDGWITKYDLWNLTDRRRGACRDQHPQRRSQRRWSMGPRRQLLSAHAGAVRFRSQAVKTFAATTLDGKQSSRVSAVYDAAPRHSFVVALKDIAELWEISYDRAAEPIHDGYVHDYRMGEAIAKPGYLNARRTPLEQPLDDFFFDQGYRNVIGATRPDANGQYAAQVVNLDVRRKIADLAVAGMPHLGSGITFRWNGRTVLASPNLRDGALDVIDMTTWKPVRTIATPGPGFFVRSHESTPYAWADSMLSPTARDTLTIVDKRTLEVVAQVRQPGRTLAHVEFTKDGRYALASLWEDDGALIVYDAATLKEVKRLPMRRPVGKYNVWNKINRSEGTSH